ncbi:NAD(P)-dependent alcohol dehydrogenase [Rhodohalobacter mucosus]|uniref:NAD(P)-dependent alcohol dehydrogenase n=1 Tax=Rhodohalobacter mucosus TaxID=2079485 RepID=A0A316TUL0_9BACT|nr:NAD(P)-dependent alcohol dehydrogenase [Rhodohalobacter mucosus]PWN07391.1 NAD(P)-dependent alcohol dehydrogenase [Rhodohalobacter mucosus]
MKAALFRTYGVHESVVVGDTDTPEPKEHDILIRVKATTVTAVDALFRSGNEFFPRMATGIFKPKIKILGTELSGVVEKTGEKVTAFKKGDEVIADSGTRYGAHAEYVLVSDQDPVVHKPDYLPFKEAAAVTYGSLTALPFLRDHGKIKKGDRVLIIGASGSVGTYAVQLAKYYGAEVTGVTSSKNALLVKSLGADHIIDYRKTPLSDVSDQFDIIFDTVGKYSISSTRHLLRADGTYLTTVLSLRSVFDMLRTTRGNQKSILAFTGMRKSEEKAEDLRMIADLFKNHRLTAVIDRDFPLDDIHDAFDYVSQGHKAGNVVITI